MVLLGIIIVILVCIGIAKLIDNAEKREEGRKLAAADPQQRGLYGGIGSGSLYHTMDTVSIKREKVARTSTQAERDDDDEEQRKKRSRAYPDPLMPIVPLYVDIPNTGYIAAGDPVGSELHFSGFGGGESGGSGAGGSYSESGSSSSSSGSSYSDSGSSYSDSGSSSSDCSSSSSD